MATNPSNPDKDFPRADEGAETVPDQDGPHDVPDNEVIEQTLPTGSTDRKRKPWPGDTSLPR